MHVDRNQVIAQIINRKAMVLGNGASDHFRKRPPQNVLE